MTTLKVTFDKDDKPKVNGRITSPYGNSGGRSVYVSADKKYILKVDDHNYVHNDAEVYSRIDSNDRKYFVPVVAQGHTDEGYAWSIQKFLQLSWKKSYKDVDIVTDLTNKYGLEDIHSDNWAIYKGQPIIFDYGISWGNYS